MTDATATRPRTILEDIQQTKLFRSLSKEALLEMIRTADDSLGVALEPSELTQFTEYLDRLRAAVNE
jgi:hypothetical protein